MTDDAPEPRSHPQPDNDRTGTKPGRSMLAAFLLAMSAIGLGMWALDLRSRLDTANDEISRLEGEIAQVRENADSTSYAMATTPDGPPSASGTAYLSISGSGILAVANLPQAPAGMRYQLWYFPTGGQAPLPGTPVPIDAKGQGFSLLALDVGPISTLGITLEPIAGSTTPTGPMLLTGSLSDARG